MQFLTDHPVIAGAVIGAFITGIFVLLAAIVSRNKGGVIQSYLKQYCSVEYQELRIRRERNRLKADLQAMCPHIDRTDTTVKLGINNPPHHVFSHGVCAYCDQWLPVSAHRQNFGGSLKERIVLRRRNRLMHRLDRLGTWRRQPFKPGYDHPY